MAQLRNKEAHKLKQEAHVLRNWAKAIAPPVVEFISPAELSEQLMEMAKRLDAYGDEMLKGEEEVRGK